MRLVTLRTVDGTSAARLDGDLLTPLDAPDVGTLLVDAMWRSRAQRGTGDPVAFAEADLAPVVPSPSKIVCMGLNYRAHIVETGRAMPEYPTLFAKFSEALIGARDPIVLPALATAPDWEIELALVIGRRTRHASEEEAHAAIAGYTVCNDVTMRDWQRRTMQWLQGKTFEQSTPLGPVMVTPDEIDDAADLAMRCTVDDEVVQEGRTSDMVFTPAQIVAYLSTIITLQPGDVISTGTPAGIGEARTPPRYLAPGHVLRSWIEGIGELVNPCVAEASS